MLNGWQKRPKNKMHNSIFNPDSYFIEKAITNYLDSGGKITRIEVDKHALKDHSGVDQAATTEFFFDGCHQTPRNFPEWHFS